MKKNVREQFDKYFEIKKCNAKVFKDKYRRDMLVNEMHGFVDALYMFGLITQEESDELGNQIDIQLYIGMKE